MKRAMIALLLLLIGSIAGYLFAQLGDQVYSVKLEMKRTVERKFQYACIAKVYSGIFEAGPLTKAFAAAGTDVMSVKIEGDRLLMATQASVGVGLVEPAAHQIIKQNDFELLAVSVEDDRHVHAFQFDRQTGYLMWTKSSHTLGLRGQSILFLCS